MSPSRRLATTLVVAMLGLAGCGPAADAAVTASAHGPRTALPYRPRAGAAIAAGADAMQLLAGGRPAFTAIGAAIAAARRSVHVEMYEFGRRDLAGSLVAAHRRGVAVTVIDDPSVDVTRATADRLRAAGVDVVDYPVRPMMIDHVKLLVVDGSLAIVGGINWGTGSEANHDFDAQISGPGAHNLDRVFLQDLVTCGRSGAVPPPLPDPAILVATTLPAADIRTLVLDVVENAKQSLDLQLFVLTDAGIVHALERATRRGVAVRLLVDPAQRSSDASVAALRAHGVPVRLYRSHGEKLHAKVAVGDGRTVLAGSANWSAGGFVRNHELDIELPDSPQTASDMEAPISADWAAAASGPGTAQEGPAVDGEAA